CGGQFLAREGLSINSPEVEEPTDRLNVRLFAFLSSDLSRRRVEANHVASLVEDADAIRRGAEDCLQQAGAFGDRILQLSTLGDVAGDLRGADDRALAVTDRRDRQRDIERSPILRDAHGLVVLDA